MTIIEKFHFLDQIYTKLHTKSHSDIIKCYVKEDLSSKF